MNEAEQIVTAFTEGVLEEAEPEMLKVAGARLIAVAIVSSALMLADVIRSFRQH